MNYLLTDNIRQIYLLSGFDVTLLGLLKVDDVPDSFQILSIKYRTTVSTCVV